MLGGAKIGVERQSRGWTRAGRYVGIGRQQQQHGNIFRIIAHGTFGTPCLRRHRVVQLSSRARMSSNCTFCVACALVGGARGILIQLRGETYVAVIVADDVKPLCARLSGVDSNVMSEKEMCAR